jgi:hypothetical protein
LLGDKSILFPGLEKKGRKARGKGLVACAASKFLALSPPWGIFDTLFRHGLRAWPGCMTLAQRTGLQGDFQILQNKQARESYNQ